MRRLLPLVLAVAVVAAVVVGLSQAGGSSPSSDAAAQAKPFDLHAALDRLHGAPAPLASLHAQANALLGGGPKAFQARLKSLRGHPVVVNKWGSWCGPCRHELPFFQRVGAQRGKRVAFLGIDGQDNPSDAKAFLRETPLTYPSYVDPHEAIARTVKAPANFPITVFVDRHGGTAFIRQGQYTSAAQLQADIDRYLR